MTIENISLTGEARNISLNIKTHLVLLLVAAFILLPYAGMFFASVVSFRETLVNGHFIFSLDNYTKALHNRLLMKDMSNSLIISIGTTLFSVVISLFASYATAMIKSGFRNKFEIYLYIIQMFPAISFAVPFFVIYVMIRKYTGIPMQDTYHGLIMAYTSFSLPFCILMLKNHMMSIPKELAEQAQIDGCGRLQIMFRILLPLMAPGILTVSVYSFLMSWNEILFASIFTKAGTQTVAIGLTKQIFQIWPEWCAACVVITLPVVIAFSLLQKFFLKGLGSNLFLK